MSARVCASAVAVSAMRGTGEALVQLRQPQVVLAEIVAPLADAVCFVDRQQAEQAAFVQRVEHRQEARRQDALGRRIQQHQAAAHQLALDLARLVAVERGVEERRVHAGLLERADLVVHQRDQRADDQRHAAPGAVARDRRHLVAQALAAAGGHQHQGVAAAAHVLDDGVLRAAKTAVAEHLAQQMQSLLAGGTIGMGADVRRP